MFAWFSLLGLKHYDQCLLLQITETQKGGLRKRKVLAFAPSDQSYPTIAYE